MDDDWKSRIVSMICVKQELMKLDADGIFPHHFPEVAATDNELIKAEFNLGYSIDCNYYEFLKAANGWKRFLQTVDLFGTHELLGGAHMQYALFMLQGVEESVISAIGFSRDELLPIAVTKYDKDLFVMSIPSSHTPGVVIWIAGSEIERYSSFIEYFLSMIDYNRLLVEELYEQY